MSGDSLLAGSVLREMEIVHLCVCVASGLTTCPYGGISIQSWGLHPDDLYNFNHLPNAPPLNTIVGLSVHPLSILKWRLNFNMSFRVDKP